MIASLIATPFCLFFALLLAGSGHGSYFPAKVLFPYTMISALLLGTITVPLILLSIIQFPIYGFALGVAKKKGWFVPIAGLILILHIAALMLCFMMAGENF